MDDSESLSEIPKMYTLALKSNHSHQQQQPPPQVPVKAKRSKRTRSLSISWSSCSGGGGPLPTSSSSSQSTTTTTTITSTTTSSTTSSPAYYYHSSQPIYAHSSAFEEMTEFKNRQKPKKRGRKPKQVTLDPTNGERRCSHCGVNKTPQWRTGPMGPKTLCNACGVRYKSGRPLPEYWPACSPTFLSHVHSNIRRKVLEMRRKKEGQEKLVFYLNPV